MPARLHPGEVILSMHHSVITLHAGGEPGGAETAFLSLYDIAYSIEVGGGYVALLRVPSLGLDTVLADTEERGRRMQARLKGIGTTMAMLNGPIVRITDVFREPWAGDGFGYRVTADGLDIHARWDECEPPFFAEGVAPSFSEREDIWSVFVAARRASLVINGVAAPGAPYDDDVWKPRLPRSVSSAHSALGETRLRPSPARVPG